LTSSVWPPFSSLVQTRRECGALRCTCRRPPSRRRSCRTSAGTCPRHEHPSRRTAGTSQSTSAVVVSPFAHRSTGHPTRSSPSRPPSGSPPGTTSRPWPARPFGVASGATLWLRTPRASAVQARPSLFFAWSPSPRRRPPYCRDHLTAMRLQTFLSPRLTLVVLSFATIACRYNGVGLGEIEDGGTRDADADTRKIVRTGTVGLPRAGSKSIAVWTSSGGGPAAADRAAVSVSLGLSPVPGAVPAPSGAHVTVGHFVDTLE
jgi:hypothetical protein